VDRLPENLHRASHFFKVTMQHPTQSVSDTLTAARARLEDPDGDPDYHLPGATDELV
jgi:hypothetical protein